jgi:hypothetical protein
MLQRPVSPGPGRDDDPGRAEEDWLAWCEAVGEPWNPDEGEPGEDAAPWDVDLDALIAECRQVTAEEAAFAAQAAQRGLPGGTPIVDGRRGPGQPGSAAAANPKTTWCVTVTNEHGHAVGHGEQRPGANQADRVVIGVT